MAIIVHTGRLNVPSNLQRHSGKTEGEKCFRFIQDLNGYLRDREIGSQTDEADRQSDIHITYVDHKKHTYQKHYECHTAGNVSHNRLVWTSLSRWKQK